MMEKPRADTHEPMEKPRADAMKPSTIMREKPVDAMARRCDEAEYYNEGKATRRGDGASM